MDLDTLIREADPSRAFPAADVWSPEAEHTFDVIMGTPPSRRVAAVADRRKRRWIYVAALLSAALAVLGVVVFAANSPVTPSAAATVLDEAATRAALVPITTPGPGQYFYQQTVSLQNCTFLSGVGDEFVYLTPMVTQTWTASDGSGIERRAPQGSGHFQTPEEATRFATGGLSNPCAQIAQTRSIPRSTPQQPGVADLPTDPQTLKSLIAAGRVDDVGRVMPSATRCPSKNGDAPQVYDNGEVCSVAAQFDIVNNLLASPQGPARLGAVLFQVAAELPSVRIIGLRTDALGRTGTAIEDPSSGDILVVGPATGVLFETETVVTGNSPMAGASPGVPIGTVLNSTTYGLSGIVDGKGVTPQS